MLDQLQWPCASRVTIWNLGVVFHWIVHDHKTQSYTQNPTSHFAWKNQLWPHQPAPLHGAHCATEPAASLMLGTDGPPSTVCRPCLAPREAASIAASSFLEQNTQYPQGRGGKVYFNSQVLEASVHHHPVPRQREGLGRGEAAHSGAGRRWQPSFPHFLFIPSRLHACCLVLLMFSVDLLPSCKPTGPHPNPC